jgi:anti-sigma B factor antagonist
MTLELNPTPHATDVEIDVGAITKTAGAPPLQVFVSRGESTTRVVLAGELDGATALFLSEQLRQVTADLVGDLTMDIGLLTFIDSTGLSLLVSLHKQLQARERTFTVRDPTPMARRLFQITGLDDVLTLVPAG